MTTLATLSKFVLFKMTLPAVLKSTLAGVGLMMVGSQFATAADAPANAHPTIRPSVQCPVPGLQIIWLPNLPRCW